MSEPSIKMREDRARRALAKHYYHLRKTPSRSWLRQYYDPGYMIMDRTNTVREGCYSREYQATLERVEEFVERITSSART
jgi:hypothetical protein